MSEAGATLGIVGGGPAGAALACLVAGTGRDVVLFEREAGPHDKVCGDFLSREAALYLDALGIDLPGLGAVPIRRVRLSAGARVAEAVLPFAAWSLRRRVLDEAILLAAERAGASLRRGRRVGRIDRDRDGRFTLYPEGAEAVRADRAIIATGKHDLRAAARPPGRQSRLIGFKTYLRLAPAASAALADAVEIALFGGGYAGLQRMDDGSANLCLVVDRDRFKALGRSWEALFAHVAAGSRLLAERLAGSRAVLPRPLAIAGTPYGFVARRTAADAPWRVGDQAAVIPSFSGDGISIALHSAFRAAGFLAPPDRGDFQPTLAREVGDTVARATMLSQLAVHRPAQHVLVAVAANCPGALRLAARLTRVPDRHLVAVPHRARSGPAAPG